MNNEYYKKYLKYKTKYLELLKQSGDFPVGVINSPLEISKPWYNLSGHTLFCTSDFEGGTPFKNLIRSENIIDTVSENISNTVLEALNKAFIFDPDGNISKLKTDTTAFAFLGDLLDNNAFSIRLMERMINLKETYPKRVILLGGNRDFNKIRMGIELFIHTCDAHPISGDKGLPWDGTVDIQGLLDRLSKVKFEFRHQGIPDYLKDIGLWDNSINKGELDIYNDKNNINERIKIMYSKTLGIMDGTKFMKQEISEMFRINLNLPNYSEEVVAKLICTIHMVMAFDWSEVKLPSYLSRFNALYKKYLTYCHVIAGFTMDGKIGVLSHGSLPIKTGIERTLTHPFGYDANSPLFVESKETKLARENRELQKRTDLIKEETINRPKTSEIEKLRSEIKPTAILKPLTPTQLEGLKTDVKSKQSSLLSVVSMIEIEKIELIKEYQQLRYMPYEYSKFPMITKFVHLTALTKDPKYPQANATYSPVVWSQPEDISKFPDIQLRLVGESISELKGGSPGYENWINNDKPKSHHIVQSGSDYVHYNIFGHTPAFFNPTYYRVNKTLHVNLDASKIEAQSNLSSFGFLVINRKETRLMGRIKFNTVAKNKEDGTAIYQDKVGYNTETIRSKLSGQFHYYNELIKESGPAQLLKTDTIIGLPYTVEMQPGFNKLIK
jgi:hypothetical protein